jgi:hypothetical protein
MTKAAGISWPPLWTLGSFLQSLIPFPLLCPGSHPLVTIIY